ncbi:cytochrome c-type biogenesis protein CcmH [Thermus sp. PS18]|uniref:cytochrome c-type biogenesis protein n=1 Tax=Thermus sp. PS18 TaxID=2849039 RepID=UPI002263B36C|nr:cytochrome c-type biogenesis protein CcmH [Thermus sp. PS18]UZX15534.1 cytochrome c-type biogenesis protein CcmH [Thermus sp. PS18]
MRVWALLFFLALGAWAQENPASPPPDLSPEVFAIARELRCPVCQGESAAESNSGVAVEMRRLIAEMLKEGKTEEEIKAFFVDRYGEWILYEPPRRGVTLWVWVLPVLGLVLLGLGLFAYFRPKKPLPPELLEEAERRLKEPPA